MLGDLGKKQKRQNILEWLSPGDYWQRHNNFRARYVPGIGNWLLESNRFKIWTSGTGSPALICPGSRK